MPGQVAQDIKFIRDISPNLSFGGALHVSKQFFLLKKSKNKPKCSHTPRQGTV